MRIIIYTKTGCPWCTGVMDMLTRLGVPFEERNVTDTPAFFEEMKQKSGQTKTPTLDIDGTILPDSDADQVRQYLKDKGAQGL